MGEGIKTRRGESNGIMPSSGIYLYNEGDECTALTGGWSKAGYNRGVATLTKNATNMTLYVSTSLNQTVSVLTENTYDFTPYTTAFLDATMTGSGTNIWSKFSLESSRETRTSEPARIIFNEIQAIDGVRRIYELPLASINTSYYMNFTADKSGSSTQTVVIHKIWLE